MSFASVQAAQDVLQAVLEAASAALPPADQFRVHAEVSDVVDPPAAVLSPPSLTWAGPGVAPTDATWSVAVVVAEGKGTTTADLYRVLPQIAEAIDMETDFVVTKAEPGSWFSGNSTLPCFLLTIEVAL
jgi:hypothetical protein